MPLPSSLGFVLVVSAGTPVQLSPTKQTISSLRLQPRTSPSSANVGNIYIGTRAMNKSTGAGVFAILSPEQVEWPDLRGPVDISQIWMDADTSGDGALVNFDPY